MIGIRYESVHNILNYNDNKHVSQSSSLHRIIIYYTYTHNYTDQLLDRRTQASSSTQLTNPALVQLATRAAVPSAASQDQYYDRLARMTNNIVDFPISVSCMPDQASAHCTHRYQHTPIIIIIIHIYIDHRHAGHPEGRMLNDVEDQR